MTRIVPTWTAGDQGRLLVFFKALSDKSRLRILSLLCHGELCGCDIQYVLGASQSNVSRHLTYLKNSGMVRDRRAGYRVYYRLAHHFLADHKFLFQHLERVFKRDSLFAADQSKLTWVIKDGACTVSDPHAEAQARRGSKHQDNRRRSLHI